jgi:DNA mismatch endonuclease (patch repair protein)
VGRGAERGRRDGAPAAAQGLNLTFRSVGMPFENVPEVVRHRMSRIRKTGSTAEVRVRQIAHRLGYRFRINRRDLPGTPDIVFPSRRKVIFVHGCFWHQHAGCRHANVPRTRQDYWLPKLARTRLRDLESLGALASSGWEALVIWECEISNGVRVSNQLLDFLGPQGLA